MLQFEPEKIRRRPAYAVEPGRSLAEENATVRATQAEAQPESHSDVRG